jgi:hypothetical protein
MAITSIRRPVAASGMDEFAAPDGTDPVYVDFLKLEKFTR